MNKLEVADLIEQIPQELTPDEFLVALATKAAEVEREACAKVCEELLSMVSTGDEHMDGVTDCIAAIRARGEK